MRCCVEAAVPIVEWLLNCTGPQRAGGDAKSAERRGAVTF